MEKISNIMMKIRREKMKQSEEKEKNVLVLAMSTIGSLEKNYYYKKYDDGYVVFEGISQLEPGTKYLINKLAKDNQIIDKIIILTSDKVLQKEVSGVKAVDLYKGRILEYIGAEKKYYEDIQETIQKEVIKQYEDSSYTGICNYINQFKEKICEELGNAIAEGGIGKIEEVYKKKRDDYLSFVENKNVAQDRKKEIQKIFKAVFFSIYKDNGIDFGGNERDKIKDIYKNKVDKLFDSDINLDRNANAAVLIRNKIMEMTKDDKIVNVYLNMQGGFRTSIYSIYTAIEMIHDKNVVVKEQFALDYEPSNVMNEVIDETARYAILKLSSGLDSFIRYGKADDLNEYLRRSLDSGNTASDENKIVDAIQEISDAITIADPVRFKSSIKELKELIEKIDSNKDKNNSDSQDLVDVANLKHESDKINQVDRYFEYILNNIKKEYEEIFKDDEYQEINIIKWFNKKGFVAQALTYIEDKMPSIFLNDENDSFIRLKLEEGDFNIKKQFNSPPYMGEEEKFHFIFDYLLSFEERNKERFFKDVLEIICSAVVEKENIKSGIVIDFDDKFIDKCTEEKVTDLNKYYELCKEEKASDLDKYCENNHDIIKKLFENLKKTSKSSFEYKDCTINEYIRRYRSQEIVGKNSKEKENMKNVYIACRLLKNNVGDLYKEKEAPNKIGSVLKTLNKCKIYKVRKNPETIKLYFYILIKRILLDDKDDFTNLKEVCKIFSEKINENNKNAKYYLWLELLEYYLKNCRRKESQIGNDVEGYIKEHYVYVSDDKEAEFPVNDYGIEIKNKLTKENIERMENSEFLDTYLEYNNIINQIHKSEKKDKKEKFVARSKECTFFNADFYFKMGEEFFDKYKQYHINGRIEPGEKLLITSKIYKTVAGIDNRYAEEIDMKWLNDIIEWIKLNDNIDGNEKARRILEDTILLHRALKNERNNTNHASTKHRRLPLKIVSKAIDLYVQNVKYLIGISCGGS